MRQSQRGFILIIVVAVLGVLATLAAQLAQTSAEARRLSNFHLSVSRSRLLCRSGLELGISRQVERISGAPARASAVSVITKSLQPMDNTEVMRVILRDTAGCLNPNDGIRAGVLELPDDYQANQVDPWPAGIAAMPWPNPGAAPGTANAVDNFTVISGMINLRIRALFNAFGDAHRYIATPSLGWPGSPGHSPGTPFTFTSTESGPRGLSAPSRNPGGAPLTIPTLIAQTGKGLGDRIVAARPPGGYTSMAPVVDLVNAWGDEHLPTAYLEGRPFFDRVSADIALDTFEDDRFFRLFQEHGKFQPDHQRTLATQSQIKDRKFLDSAPPDFVNRQNFMPHSVALINLNSASDLVKAAVFYSPSNVSYLCEGAALDVITPDGKYMKMKNAREWVGVGGPSFDPNLMTENGNLISAQKDRLMSLTDALKLAALYGQEATPPVSFPQFEHWLSEARHSGGITYERARLRTFGGMRPPYITLPNDSTSVLDLAPAYFTQEYVEKTLPHIFSCVRRLPGYMGAPAPLLSPYIQQGEHRALWYHHTYTGAALRSAEDLVYREHLPKVAFLPHGRLRIFSTGVLTEGARQTSQQLKVEVLLHETRILRTQKDFEDHTVFAQTHADILIGPEPRERGVTPPFPVSPSLHYGVVGLRDSCEDYPSGNAGQVTMTLKFDGRLTAEAGGTLGPADATSTTTDPHLRLHVIERPPSLGYPDLLADDWPTVKGKLSVLRTTAPSSNTTMRATWMVPRDTRDLRMELYRLGRQTLATPTPADLNLWFRNNAPLYTDSTGAILDLVDDGIPASETLDEINYRVTQVRGYAPLIEPRTAWALWCALGPDQAINWRNGAPRMGDITLRGSMLEGGNRSLFLTGSTGCDLSPFGGVFLSSRGHGVRAAPSFMDSLYLRPITAFTSNFKTGQKFNRGYVSLWVRMPSGYHSSNARKSIFQLNLWDKTDMKARPPGFTGGTAASLNAALAAAATVPTYRPTQFSVYLEGDTSFTGDPDAQYSIVAKHQKDTARKAYTQFSTMDEEVCPYPLMLSDPIYGSAGAFAAGLSSCLAPLTQYGYPPALMQPQNNMAYVPTVDYNAHWRTFAANLDSWVLQHPDQNANASKEMLEGPYGNIPGSWRRVVCRWDLQIPPQGGNERLALVTDPHMSAVVHRQTPNLLPGPAHPEKLRPYHGVCDANPGMIWSFGEVVTCYDPQYIYGGGVNGVSLPLQIYRGDITTNFSTNHPAELLSSGMNVRYPDAAPHPYAVIQQNTPPMGLTLPLMRLNSSIDNIVVKMGETGASDPPVITQGNVASWVEGSTATSSRRYLVDASNEPEWMLNPALPEGSRLLYVGARVYDPVFIMEAHIAGISQPWQAPIVDYHAQDSLGNAISMDTETSTAAEHAGFVYTSPALRRPLGVLRCDPATRLKVRYVNKDARGNPLDSDALPFNFNDIPWIEEVSWSFVPRQVKFLSFQWE